jgi:uncharacterized protein
MNDLVFVDTGAWFAAVVPWDANHSAASAWLGQNQQPLVTTDYVVDETLTLLRARGETQRALDLGRALFSGHLASIHYLTAEEIRAAWEVFQRFGDKDWSFTDCTSRVIIERLGCTRALAFDEHFRQFGVVPVEP